MTFLHTMANQLASHLGRLKIVKKLEKSKMDSVIQSMTEAILMTDESNQLEVINPAAAELFGIDPEVHISAEQLREKFEIFGVSHLFQRTLQTGKAYLNNEVSYQDRIYLVNVTPVFNVDNQRSGTVMVLRDFTEIQKNNRIKTQRLEIISQVNVIIKSITDLDNLLSVLMQFILNVVNAEMGAIQLQSGKRLQTKVHSNFPDKIQKEFRFKTGEPISEFVARNKDLCFIEDYHADLRVDPQAKILLESFIGIPILAKDELIGVVSIARKYANEHPKVSADDIRTLTTITSLSGTAIQNALLYQETLKKQRLDQELKIATEIHTKLLPTTLPALNQVEFGAKSVPARAIGGDYYDFFKLDNGHLGICIADIVGKGVPAGLFMAMLKSLLHSHFKSFDSPSAALNAVNRFLFRDPVINKFVPMFYAVLDPATLVLRYCNAGHEPALRLSGSECEILDADGFPLGGFEDSVFEEKTIQLEEHDVLTFFT
ncbi:PAS domain-containing protein, partial [bacterium]|nr:PAS domain-containing protein [bacterium]